MYHISFYVPLLDAKKVKSAMFEAGVSEHENLYPMLMAN